MKKIVMLVAGVVTAIAATAFAAETQIPDLGRMGLWKNATWMNQGQGEMKVIADQTGKTQILDIAADSGRDFVLYCKNVRTEFRNLNARIEISVQARGKGALKAGLWFYDAPGVFITSRRTADIKIDAESWKTFNVVAKLPPEWAKEKLVDVDNFIVSLEVAKGGRLQIKSVAGTIVDDTEMTTMSEDPPGSGGMVKTIELKDIAKVSVTAHVNEDVAAIPDGAGATRTDSGIELNYIFRFRA